MSTVTADTTELNPAKLTMLHRWKAANLLIDKSSEASRNIMSQFAQTKDFLHLDNTKASKQFCQKCGTIFTSGNHTVSFASKPSYNGKVRKSLKRTKRKRGAVKAEEKRNVDKYYESKSQIKLSCKICFHNNILPGASRNELETVDVQKNKSNDFNLGFVPTSFGKPNKTSTPVRTNTSNTSINKSSKRKRTATSRLSSLLKNQSSSSPNGSLQDFLSSL